MLDTISMLVTIAALASLRPTTVQQERARVSGTRRRFRDYANRLRAEARRPAPGCHHNP